MAKYSLKGSCPHVRHHPTYTPVLGLPSEEVQERSKRLSDETKADPEDAVSNDPTFRPAHIIQWCGEGNQRQLEHHPKERDTWT